MRPARALTHYPIKKIIAGYSGIELDKAISPAEINVELMV